MIKEDYCSFEVAQLLKEKGFDEPCLRVYDKNGIISIRYLGFDIPHDYTNRLFYLCPTHQMAMKWLRETHNINIDIVPIWNQKRFEYQVFVVTPENAKQCYIDDKLYLGYEEAVEAGIKYCLEKLI